MTREVLATVVAAMGAAFLYALSNVYQESEAEQIEEAQTMRLGLLGRLARRPRWWIGMGSDVGGYVFEAIALGIGSLILVEPILAMSLPFSLLLSRILQRRTIDRSGWIAALLLATGVASFLYEVAPNGGAQTASLRSFTATCLPVVLVIFLCIALARTATVARRAALLGVAAGSAFAISAVMTKAFVHYLGQGVFAWAPHWEPYMLAVSAIGGLVCSQSAFQTGVLPAAVGAEQVMQPTVGVVLGAVLLHEQMAASGRLDFVVVVLAIIAMAYGVVGVTRAEYSEVGEVGEPAIHGH
jgi:hypothetical protein